MKKIISLVIILSVSACGYHLRNSNNIGDKYPEMQLLILAQSPLKEPLVNALTLSGVMLVEKSDAYDLAIKKDELQKVIQSIGANNQVQEYRLEYIVEYTLGDEEIKLIQLERDYSFDIQEIGGGQEEEATLRRQLAEDMARAIVRKINASIINAKKE